MSATHTPSQNEKKSKNVLIVTSSGGGGLLETANAKAQEILRADPNACVIKKDLLRDWGMKNFNQFCINLWDNSQRKGNVKLQVWLIYMKKFADFLFWPRIFFRTFNTLLQNNIDRVIDTQLLGTSAFIKAIRLFNRLRNKNVVLEKVIVDLPTDKATPYFHTIRRLSSQDRKQLRVITIQPLLENGETAEEFWQRHCKLSDKEIQYEDFFIREGFTPYRNKPRLYEDFAVKVAFKNPEELSLMKAVYQKGKVKAIADKGTLQFIIGKDDELITLLLGSQPAFDATLNYVKKVIQIAKQPAAKDKRYYLFVFCSNHTPGKNTLYKKVHDSIVKMKNYPSSLVIVPISFQAENVIASLFFRSDLTITRSGGQTSMELMAVMSGKIMIHSETKRGKRKSLSKEDLLKGIPGWEAGNARYLIDKRNAKLVTPESLVEEYKLVMQKDEKLSVVHQMAN